MPRWTLTYGKQNGHPNKVDDNINLKMVNLAEEKKGNKIGNHGRSDG